MLIIYTLSNFSKYFYNLQDFYIFQSTIIDCFIYCQVKVSHHSFYLKRKQKKIIFPKNILS